MPPARPLVRSKKSNGNTRSFAKQINPTYDIFIGRILRKKNLKYCKEPKQKGLEDSKGWSDPLRI